MPDQEPVPRLNAALEGRYRIERQLGEGGMATVYLADDLRHERKVALKVLKPELAAVVGAERFLAEIKTTANLQHPHILPLFDSGEAGGFLFYVMPYVEGESLRERLDREHQLPVDEAVQITKNVAEALNYAHAQGVIHRDIKPANILLQAGKPVVSDFGIALAVSAAGGGRITETGLSLGSPHYMSPEQASADRDLTARSDVYSLGCVLYEMLAGQPPHTGPSAQSILVHILTEDPRPVDTHRHTVPPNVAGAVAKAIEKLPADRFETPRSFMEALGDPAFTYRARRRAVVGGAAARPPSADGGWKRLSTVLATLLVAASALATWAFLRPDPPQPVSRQYFSTDGWAGTGSAIGDRAALAPDGSSMILPIEGERAYYLLGLKLRESEEVVPIPGTETATASNPVYSPDGQWIAYAVGAELRKRPIVGGSTVTLAEDVAIGIPGLAWLDDGTILYDQEAEGYAGTARVVQISEDGGDPLGVVFELAEIYHIQGLPGGRGAIVIGCESAGCGGDENNAYLVDLRDGSSELLVEGAMRAWYAPSGHVVYVRRDGGVFANSLDPSSLSFGASGVPLFEGVRAGALNIMDMLVGADGTLLYVEASSTRALAQLNRLVVVDLDGNAEPLGLSERPIASAAWSKDGESIAFESEDHIYTYDVTPGSIPQRRTFYGENRQPHFSPDGTRVAFSSVRAETLGLDVFMKDLLSDSPPVLLVSLPGGQRVTQWPTDSLIVFEQLQGASRSDLWTLDLSDPDSAKAAPYLEVGRDGRQMAVSPDGTLAAYQSGPIGPGPAEIQVRRFPVPGEPTVVWSNGTLGSCCPRWSPDGEALFFVRQSAGSGPVQMRAAIQREPVPAVLSIDSLFAYPEGVANPGPGGMHPTADRWLRLETLDPPGAGGATETRPDRVILVENWFEELRGRVPN